MMLKELKTQWTDNRLITKISAINGLGIFTTDDIVKGEVVMIWGGTLFSCEEISAGKVKPNSISGYCDKYYLGQPVDSEDTIDQFLNHSCNPNLWMLDAITIVAMVDIPAGTELTADYIFWEIDNNWKMPSKCNCGSINCRESITGMDWKNVELQKKYKGHFLPLINERIKKLESSLALQEDTIPLSV